MTPDYDLAATKAYETLLKHKIFTAPVDPLPIYKRTPGVLVLSFTEMSNRLGMDRDNLLTSFDTEQHDAVTSVHLDDGWLRYIVTYNQRLPFYLIQRALARELGHIVLGHDGMTRPDDIRNAEALTFAHHLLCPRPVLQAIQEAGVRLTVEVVGNITGCYERCIAAIRREPGAIVPAELNRAVKGQFADHINNFLAFQKYFAKGDGSALADFGPYMDNYAE